MTRRVLVIALIAGAIVRVAALRLPGTPDTGSWKVWSFAGSSDATGLYGVGGRPPERRQLHWQGIVSTTEYPPLGLFELAAAGTVYKIFDPEYRDTRWLDAWLKVPGILMELAFVVLVLTWGRRVFDEGVARWIAVAFWINPTVLLNGSVLGYLDAQMAVPAALAFVAAAVNAPVIAGALIAAAILTKAQALFALPVLAVACWQGGRTRALSRAALGGVVVTALVLLPFAARGALPNMAQSLNRMAVHDMLSGNAANFWWIVTWFTRAAHNADLTWWPALTKPVRILAITDFARLYFNPKLWMTLLVAGGCLWAAWRARRSTSAIAAAALAAWCVYAYSMFSMQVHENHLYLAVPLLALAAGADRRYRGVFWAVSIVAALNMYLFYGFGDTWAPYWDRRWTGIDTTVLLSCANIVSFGWLTGRLVSIDNR